VSAERLLTAFAEGRRVFGIPLRSPDPAIVEIAAIAGYDWVAITLEHASLTVREVAAMQRAADFRGITTLVHVVDPGDPRILPLLDEGVGGIVLSGARSAEDTEALMRAVRFPPRGERGAGGVTRRSDYGAKPYASYMREVDRLVAAGAVIETREGVENAESILAVDGLHLVYIGFHDLAQSYGVPGDFSDPQLREAVDHVIGHARRNGVAVGMAEKGFTIAELCELGVTMLINAPCGEYIALLEALRSRLEVAKAEAAA
jgi:4-hydroxy-2-oxoheptanedioate aldolase